MGYFSDTRLPEKIGGQELKAKDLEVKRSDKWIKMYKAWPKYKNGEKFVKRTYKGIPNKVRGLFWQLMLDLENIKKQQEGKYMVSVLTVININQLFFLCVAHPT